MQVRTHSSLRTSSLLFVLVPVLAATPERALAEGAGAMQPPKQSQTAAQRKIDSHLLREIDRARREGDKLQPDPASGVEIDAKGRALVEIRCDVTDAMRTKLRALNATTVSSLPAYRSILAWVPLTRLEELAADQAVYGIQPAPKSMTNRPKEGL
ncbi:MAG TPA: hypothetical protein VKE96_28990 [Vicinamibacterales bacterium]|nr:hypothetical protein [Vicinamibacterales bacterium]